MRFYQGQPLPLSRRKLIGRGNGQPGPPTISFPANIFFLFHFTRRERKRKMWLVKDWWAAKTCLDLPDTCLPGNLVLGIVCPPKESMSNITEGSLVLQTTFQHLFGDRNCGNQFNSNQIVQGCVASVYTPISKKPSHCPPDVFLPERSGKGPTQQTKMCITQILESYS